MSMTRPLFAALAIVLFSGGCEKDHPKNEDEFCIEYAKRECQKVSVACSLDPAGPCATTRGAACRDFLARSRSSTRGFRPENVDECLDKVSKVYEKPAITPDDMRALEDVCGRVFLGTAKKAEACMIDFDCAGDLICDPSKKRCGDKKLVAPDGFCGNPGEICQKGQFCKAKDASLVCSRRAERGMACSSSDPCLESLRCLSGLCSDRLPVMSTCESDDECDTGYCFPYLSPKICANALNFALGSPSCAAYQGRAPEKVTAPAQGQGAPDAGSLDAR